MTLEIYILIFENNEHTELLKDYIKGKGGMAKIAEVHGISSGTVHNHIKKHNKERARAVLYRFFCTRYNVTRKSFAES